MLKIKSIKSYISIFIIVLIGLSSLFIMDFNKASATPVINEFHYSPYVYGTPGSLTAGPDGNLWFVAANNYIGRLNADHTFSFFQIPTASAGPASITAGPDGNLWFTESQTNKIARITTSGSITEYPIPTPSSNPFSITAGPDGNLWFTESGANQIGKITTSGDITEYTTPSGSNPQYITAGPDGNVWFSDPAHDKVAQITTTGNIIEFSDPHNNWPSGLTNNPDGFLWYRDGSANYLSKVSTDGSITAFPIPAQAYGEHAIASAADGSLWFSESNTNDITNMTDTGSLTQYSMPGTLSAENSLVNGPDGNIWFTANSTQNGAEVVQLVLANPIKPKPSLVTKTISIFNFGKAIVINVLSGISGAPDPNTLKIVKKPLHGTAIDPPSTISYTPNSGYIGKDHLTFRVCSYLNEGLCTSAELILNISKPTISPDTGYGTSDNISRLTVILALVLLGSVCVGALAIKRIKSSI